LLLQEAAKSSLVDTGVMPDLADTNGITSADLLSASKDTDLVF
jgi:hypothetical protein